MRRPDLEELAEGIRAGRDGALGRGVSLLEDDPQAGSELLTLLGGERRGMVVGVTGPPGVGKSTLVSRLILAARADGLSVGAVLVDPSSPFGGGAVLGDRYRLAAEAASDREVFVRSMGSRGSLGGLATATGASARLLAAAGKDAVLVETVGVGQADVEIEAAADLVALVLQPGTGDDVQADKAGLMEIPDVLVLNKADQPGADAALRVLRHGLRATPRERRPALVPAVAETGDGVAEAWTAIRDTYAALERRGELTRRRARRIVVEAAGRAADLTSTRARLLLEEDGELRGLVARVRDGAASFDELVERTLERLADREGEPAGRERYRSTPDTLARGAG